MHKFNFFLTSAKLLSDKLLNIKLHVTKSVNYLDDLILLFYPEQCAICGHYLLERSAVLCFRCSSDLPVCHWNDNNRVEKLFYGRLSIQAAASGLIFHKKSSTQKLLHLLKYKGRQDIGTYLSRQLVDDTLSCGKFSNVDCVMPVPLHPKKLRSRGYNQVTTFGKQLSLGLGVPYKEKYLKRKGNRKSQTRKSRYERNQDLSHVFYLENSKYLINKHILLVDDIITSGATLEACASLILAIEGTQVSLASLAFTE